jgi:hypothetical protein
MFKTGFFVAQDTYLVAQHVSCLAPPAYLSGTWWGLFRPPTRRGAHRTPLTALVYILSSARFLNFTAYSYSIYLGWIIMALPLPCGLVPSEVAFLCEMELITVVARQRLESIQLLSVRRD